MPTSLDALKRYRESAHETYSAPPRAAMRAVPTVSELTCKDIYNHVQGCPVCTQLYSQQRPPHLAADNPTENNSSRYLILILLVTLALTFMFTYNKK